MERTKTFIPLWLSRIRIVSGLTILHIRTAFVVWYNAVRRIGKTRMPIDNQRLNLCLVETEQELIRIGRERHDFLQQQSQDAALILLLLRCCSLFRAMLSSLQRHARGRGLNAPDLGSDYGELSGLAHPTRDAAENSAAIILWKNGMNEYGETVEDAITALENGCLGMLYRLLWLALDEDQSLIPLGLEDGRMPTALGFCKEFQASRQ